VYQRPPTDRALASHPHNLYRQASDPRLMTITIETDPKRIGMAATDPRLIQSDQLMHGKDLPANPAQASPPGERQRAAQALRCLGAQELHERLEEEVSRAVRHGTPLCCLLLRLRDFDQIAQRHGQELADHALLHAGSTLLSELRRFDRIGRPRQDELLVLLPGAASAQGESVARRALSRLRSIKIEVQSIRKPLSVSIGIAAWRAPWSAEQLIRQARIAADVHPQSATD
jgi:diguanylate cyclase (GGDEF)-like protein